MIDAVVITGAGQGIGKAVAIKLGINGIPILCISKSSNSTKTMEEIIKKGGTAESLILNIEDYDGTQKILKKWASQTKYKKIGVVLAAAILGPTGPLINSLLKEWESCLKINTLGGLAVLTGLLPKMIENKFGRIITFAGGGSAYAFPKFPAYSASKTAMVRITENIHEDLKDKGDFAVVCLAPGAVETEMLKQVCQAGAEVKTLVDISEPVSFIEKFIGCTSCGFSGSFVHVRDNWKEYLNSKKQLSGNSMWKLRRIE